MFQRPILSILTIFLLIALVLQQGLLALLLILLLLTAGMASLWNHWSLRRVSYTRHLNRDHAFPDDEIELTLRVANHKPLPLANLRIAESLPASLEISAVPLLSSGRSGLRLLQRSTALRWYESVSWRYRVRCTARGAYRIGPVRLISGDPFGFYTSSSEIAPSARLLVYPRPLSLTELGLPARNPLGDLRARQLIRDPLRSVGVRDYHPDDPLKDVHWAATARTGSLQTRIYEPSTQQSLAIFLDLDTFEYYYEGIDPEQVERMISAAATLAREGLRAGYAVGLYVNGMPVEEEHLVQLPPGRSPAQLEYIMETLARLTPYSITPIARLLHIAAGDLAPGTTLLLISSVATTATRAELLRLCKPERPLVWFYLGASPPPSVPGVQVRHAPAAHAPAR